MPKHRSVIEPSALGAWRLAAAELGDVAPRSFKVRRAVEARLGRGRSIRNLGVMLLSALTLGAPLVAGDLVVDGRLVSTADPGTAPMAVSSPTRVDNLNADMVDGLDGGDLYTRDELATGGMAAVHWDNLVGAPEPSAASRAWTAPAWFDLPSSSYTFLGVHNPGAVSTTVTVTFRDRTGAELGSDSQVLSATETRFWSSESSGGADEVAGTLGGQGSLLIESISEDVLAWGVVFTPSNSASMPLSFYRLGALSLKVGKDGAGSGHVGSINSSEIDCGPDCVGTFVRTEIVGLLATADTGSSFTAWTGCDEVDGDLCVVDMTIDRTVTATFD